MAAIARFLDDYLHNLKDKRLELKRDEESFGNSLNEEDCGYLLEKYKASLDYFIQDLQTAVDRLPQNAPAVQGNANNNPSSQSNSSVNNARNNPSGGKRKLKANKSKKTRKIY